MASSAGNWKESSVKKAVKDGIINDDDTLAMIYNISYYKRLLRQAKDLFPSNFLHTAAVKANPVMAFMKMLKEEGMGVETASLGELSIALAAGFDPLKIVFDSPAKTRSELKLALDKGVFLNLDNFQELERVKKLIDTGNYPKARIGVRINPQVGGGTIEALSTATATSKFGIPTEYMTNIMSMYKENPWLNAIHVHVGSQGCPLDLIADGIRKVVDIALSINKISPGQISIIDIGGGLPVNFMTEEDTPSMRDWATTLKSHIPELFTPEFTVLTEFGRCYNAKPGIVAAKVEYTKVSGGRGIAVIQGGADLFVRTIYLPEKWPLRVSVHNKQGEHKPDTASAMVWDIAGPCCFAGDIVAHRRPLPTIEPDDIVVVHDTGAYYYSSFSHYNCRQAPPIYGYDETTGELTLLQKGETVEDTIKFFNRQ